MRITKRLELVEKESFPNPKQAGPGNGRKVYCVTLEELQLIVAVTKKCQQLDDSDAKVLGRAFYRLTGRTLDWRD